MQLTQSLHKAVRERPRAVATICRERRRDYATHVDRISRLAGMLRRLGFTAGDRVALLAANSDRYLETLYACWWIGAVATPLNVRWSPPEITYGLHDSGASCLLVDAAFAALVPDLRAHCPALRVVLYADDGDAPPGLLDLESLLLEVDAVDDDHVSGDALAALLYTGGTTGQSKGVMLSHDNLAINSLATLAADPRDAEPSVLHSAPLFHVGGMSFALQAAARQATHVLIPAFDPAAVLGLIERENINEIFLVPTMVKMLVEHPALSQHDVSSLTTLIYGAAPMDETLLARSMRALPKARFVQAYGQTEAAPVVAILPGWCHAPEHRSPARLASAGRPLSIAELRILDRQGVEALPGTVGEICVRGPCVMRGYWNKPEQTAQALQDGWLHTGDGGYLDGNGFLHVVDRFKDMIISGGENVFSTEVENALLQHPQVSQCAVIGIQDRTWGERVHAIVVARDNGDIAEATLIEHCRSLIAGFKCPRSIEFRSALPTSAAGKILKYQLRRPA